ncbi:hypothetical protein HDU67_004365, partial [Dinochytrium kinnereticum]
MVVITEVDESTVSASRPNNRNGPVSHDNQGVAADVKPKVSRKKGTGPLTFAVCQPSTDFLTLLGLKSNPDVIALQKALLVHQKLSANTKTAVKLAVQSEEDLITARDKADASGLEDVDTLWDRARGLERQVEAFERRIRTLDSAVLRAAQKMYLGEEGKALSTRDLGEAKRLFSDVQMLHEFLLDYPRLVVVSTDAKPEVDVAKNEK